MGIERLNCRLRLDEYRYALNPSEKGVVRKVPLAL